MHLNKIGKKMKISKQYKMKNYLKGRMKIYVILLNKYGSKALANF